MGAIYAELRVAGYVFPLLHCTYGVHQATDHRGRVVEQVRFDGAQFRLDVPRVEVLKAWANDPHKRLPADIIFRESAGGAATETLSFKAAYCVFYGEQFHAGDAQNGSYVADVHLSDPDGFTMLPGGPAADFVVPAARDHGPLPLGVETPRVPVAGILESGALDVLSRGAANRSAFHPFDPLPLVSPNHVHGQSTGFTCVASCLRMVLADKGFVYGENALAEALNTSSFGASILHIPDALTQLQLADQMPTTLLNRASFAELAAAVAQGGQAVVSVTIPGLGAHALVVEEISETHVHIRDPLPLDEGSTYKVKISDFETYWNKRATIINA